MCMEDVRVMRKTLCQSVVRAVATTKGELVPRNERRVALTISPPNTNDLWLSLNAMEAADSGICLSTVAPPLKFNVQDDGCICIGPIFANITAAGEDLAYWETLLEAV